MKAHARVCYYFGNGFINLSAMGTRDSEKLKKAARENGKLGGRPKGSRSEKTLEKELILKGYRERVMGVTDLLLNSQLTLARGQQYLFKIEKKKLTGPKGGVSYIPQRPKLVTSEIEIQNYLEGLVDESDMDDNDPAATYYYLTTKDPSSQTIDSMLDRTFGKSAQSLDLTSGGKTLGVSEEAQAMANAALNKFLNGNPKK